MVPVEFIIAFAFISYLLGSISFSVWIGRTFYKTDVRLHGSKNAGATNVFRVLGKKAGITVMILDLIKGFLAASIPLFALNNPEYNRQEIVNIQLLMAVCVAIGHILPVFAKFKGGKGVATLVGAFLAIHPESVLICIGIFIVVLLISNFVSLGSLVSGIAFPILIIFIFRVHENYLPYYSIAIALLIIYTHKKNIQRLINGNENKIYLFK